MSKKNGKKSKEPRAATPQKIAEKFSVPGIAFAGKNDGQKAAIETIETHDVSVIYGTAGSGKSHIALVLGLIGLLKGDYKKLILTRPYVEAGERLGFLPGDFSHKIAPFMQPLMEISNEYLGRNVITELMENHSIEVLPLAYMRGITVKNAYLVADEMQNASIMQMRMLLTRLGEKSKIVITGDTEQSDLSYRGESNGLADGINRLKGKVPEIGFFQMLDEHCVRNPLVAKIDKLYRSK